MLLKQRERAEEKMNLNSQMHCGRLDNWNIEWNAIVCRLDVGWRNDAILWQNEKLGISSACEHLIALLTVSERANYKLTIYFHWEFGYFHRKIHFYLIYFVHKFRPEKVCENEPKLWNGQDVEKVERPLKTLHLLRYAVVLMLIMSI